MHPKLTIIHAIDQLSKGNHGIVEAALGTAEVLKSNYGCESEIWYPAQSADSQHRFDFRGVFQRALSKDDIRFPIRLLESSGHDPSRSIIVSHGSWRWPTKLGVAAKRAGYSWVYVPHGMLEPWSLAQRKMIKSIYWRLREYQWAKNADVVRATAAPEALNLKKQFQQVALISHGIAAPEKFSNELPAQKKILFLGRFHPKKNAGMLVQAWHRSVLSVNENFELILVGSDDGDFQNIASAMEVKPTSPAISILDPVYGAEKTKLYQDCTFFALPSHSEGFPVALLEAMAHGLIPLITPGCNLPEATREGFAIPIEPELNSISTALDKLAHFDREEIRRRRAASHNFINRNYSVTAIAKQQAELYFKLSGSATNST